MKKNKNIIIIISVFIAALLILGSLIIIHNYNDSKLNELKESYVVIKETYDDSIVVSDSNTNNTRTYLTDGSKFHKGDLVVIRSKGDKVQSYEVIVEDYNNLVNPVIVVDPTDTTTTTVTTSTTQGTTNSTTHKNTTTKNTTVKTTTIVKTTTKAVNTNKDDMIINHVKSEYETIKNGEKTETFKEKAKKTFISLVDFVFYDGEIKGTTFKELKATTKAKVIYYTLLIDAGIDSKFPNYKENISDKYKDIKAKLIAEWLELKYDICQKSGDDCEQANSDFKVLKYSLNLTWDIIKGCFTYVKNLTVPKIKAWYESFRG